MLTRASKYLIPIGAFGTAAVCIPSQRTAFAASKSKRSNPACVYDEPKEDCECPPSPPQQECKETELERLVMQCRERMEPFKGNVDSYSDTMKKQFCSFYGSVKDNVCYLRTRAPDEVRIGTIAIGGLFGMMLGFRRGLTRKLLFGTLGAGSASYLVYPKETVYYINNGIPIAKKYVMVAYNFATGGTDKEECPKKCGPASTVKAEKAERNIR